MTYKVIICALIAVGVTLAWAAVSRPAVAVPLEYAGGALLIAGLALLGYALQRM